MRTVLALVALCVAGVVHARPQIVTETARIQLPVIPGYVLRGPTAVDGDDAIIIGYREEADPNGEYVDIWRGAFLFHRSGVTWSFVRKIAEGLDFGLDDLHGHEVIAMKDGIAALDLVPLFIFERQPNGEWIQVQAPIRRGGAPADDIEIDGGRIFLGSESWGGEIFTRNAAGVWESSQRLLGDMSGDGDSSSGGPIDFSGRWAAILNPYNLFELPAPAITTYYNDSGLPAGWVQTERLLPDEGHTFGDLAIRGNEMFIDEPPLGIAHYVLGDDRGWRRRGQLRVPGDFLAGSYNALSGVFSGEMKKSDNYIFHRTWDYDRNASVVHVFQIDAYNGYSHTATLIDSAGWNLGAMQVSGRRLIASGLIFDLPATFTPKPLFQETFETGNGRGWTAFAGSLWSVAQSGDTRVFRQSSTVGDAGASFDGANWANQSIQADIRPTAFDGADRWFGLATRRSDASNYYYVTLRSSGIVALKRNKNGAFATIASASLPVTLNRTYRVRLESFGTRHRVYVDGVVVLNVADGSLIAGHPALLTYRTAADFDNVIVSPSWTTTLYAASSGLNYVPAKLQPEPWTYSGTGQWFWEQEASGNILFRQTSNDGDARAAIDPQINLSVEQSVEARVRLRSFGTGTQEKWVGIMANYYDPQNFLYMSLRSSNMLTLRRVSSGQIQQLGTVLLPVTLNTWYQLRLESIGGRARAYVNGKLLIEVADQPARQGNGGLVTYKTAADFDDFSAVRP